MTNQANPTDFDRIAGWWSTLSSAEFLAATPPSGPTFTEDDEHDVALAEIRERGLHPDIAYAIWSVDGGFDATGALAAPHRVMSDGDPEVIARALASVPDGYRIEAGYRAGDYLLVRDRDEPIAPPSGPTASREERSQPREASSRGPSNSQPAPVLPAESPAATDSGGQTAGDVPWPGVDLTNKRQLREQADALALPPPLEIDWYRARMRDPAVGEPGLGFCLERVADAGALTRADLDLLLDGWEDRMLRKPDTYQRYRPALITFGIALARDEHPRAREVWERLRELDASWQVDLRLVLTGVVRGTRGLGTALANVAGRVDIRHHRLGDTCRPGAWREHPRCMRNGCRTRGRRAVEAIRAQLFRDDRDRVVVRSADDAPELPDTVALELRVQRVLEAVVRERRGDCVAGAPVDGAAVVGAPASSRAHDRAEPIASHTGRRRGRAHRRGGRNRAAARENRHRADIGRVISAPNTRPCRGSRS